MKLGLPLQEKIELIFSYCLAILAKLIEPLHLVGDHSIIYLHNIQLTVFEICKGNLTFLRQWSACKFHTLGKPIHTTYRSIYQIE